MWSAPKSWAGETVAIFGGGPSLTQADVDLCIRAGLRRMAINCAYLMDLEADILCWGDQTWWFHQRDDVNRHYGMKVSWMKPTPKYGDIHVDMLESLKAPPALSLDPTKIVGTNAGHGAINLAVHLGCSRILLLGFDMRVGVKNNWHDRHVRHASEERYRTVFIPEMEASAMVLGDLSIEVVNCTPGSALTCFPVQTLQEALHL